ncbi:MAG: cell division protein SepF [Geodermatophilaceae bacterium]|nr:cell division protein SepF [Geodermatophilaceae bacterium]
MSGAMRKMGIYLGLVEEDDRQLEDSVYAERPHDDRRDSERRTGYEDRTPLRAPERAPEDRTYAAPATAAFEPVPVRRPRAERAARVWTAAQPDGFDRRESVSDEPGTYRITTLHPRTYNEARTIGEHFRDGTPVIMNLSEMDDSDAKRLVDFAAGLSFGLRGTIERVTNKVFLLSPQNVSVTAEEKARIAEGGFFNQS